MPRLIPEADEAELAHWPSRAERDVYVACSRLSDDLLIVHGLKTLEPDARGIPRDGEADFTVFDPRHGLLCIEVKGGGINYDAKRDKWFGEDAQGKRVFRVDPFGQAMRRKKDLVAKVTGSAAWREARGGELPAGHAVLFPDLDEADLPRISRPDAPPEIVGGRMHLSDLGAWLEAVFTYWKLRDQRTKPFPSGAAGVVERVLAAPFEVRPRLGARIAIEEEERAHWTQLQWELWRSWPDRDRLGVCGGAGTGKTVLAVRRAQQLAAEGRRVALLCYNKPLADFLRRENQGHDLVDTMTFESFARWWLDRVRDTGGRDHLASARRLHPGRDEHHVLLPIALSWALDEQRPDYDTVLVDEGQDFGDEDWNAIDTLAAGRQLTVLFDPNQAVFRRAKNFPVGQADTFNLFRNCRNTGAIHDAAYAHYEGPRVERPRLGGTPVRRWDAPTPDTQAARIAEGVAELLRDERVLPESVVVLVLAAQRKSTDYSALEQALTRLGVPHVRERHGLPGAVLLETAGRFKGLESPVVVLWLNGGLSDSEERRFLYVAQSRACSVLVLAGSAARLG